MILPEAIKVLSVNELVSEIVLGLLTWFIRSLAFVSAGIPESTRKVRLELEIDVANRFYCDEPNTVSWVTGAVCGT